MQVEHAPHISTKAKLVKLRYFAGLTLDEAASVLLPISDALVAAHSFISAFYAALGESGAVAPPAATRWRSTSGSLVPGLANVYERQVELRRSWKPMNDVTNPVIIEYRQEKQS